jgi:hypothetical protein
VQRPALEVADIFRAHGPAWRHLERGHFSLGQLKVMSAIEQCRSVALGGHVLRCQACAEPQIAVKAEGSDGRRLRIDKATLREWREDFAREMRAQGVAANATSRVLRGKNGRFLNEKSVQAVRRGRSDAFRAKVEAVVRELASTKTIHDPARSRMLATRKALLHSWMEVAAMLDAQGEMVLAGDVRNFANRLPPVLTDRQQIAVELIHRLQEPAKTQEKIQAPTR